MKQYIGTLVTALLFSTALPLSAQQDTKLQGDSIRVKLRTSSTSPTGVEGLFQQTPVSTPETDALVSIANRPVNYCTGVPEIKIPIYTVASGSLQLPIYLTYDASGVKVGNSSGWVGQNWTLVAEPMLTISKKGHYDSQHTCELDTSQQAVTYAQAVRVLDTANPYSSNDSHPDEYCYRLAGKSGMFMYLMHPDGERFRYASLPYDNVAVSLTSGTPSHFVLTDDDGTKYDFSGAYIYSNSLSGYDLGWKASSMVSANGRDSITFEYGGLNQTVQYFHSESYQVMDDFDSNMSRDYSARANLFTTIGDTGLDTYSRDLTEPMMKAPIIYHNVGNTSTSFQLGEDGTLVPDNAIWGPTGAEQSASSFSPTLKTIKFKGNKVDFSFNGHTLNSIQVTNYMGEVVCRFSLSYISSSGRYFLTSVSRHSGSGGPEEKYTFEYNQYTGLPQISNKHIDFWGYLNSAPYNDNPSLVPTMKLYVYEDCDYRPGNYNYWAYRTDSVVIGNSNPLSRASSGEWMIKGSLKSITYPTGGKEEFVMEPNRVYLSPNVSYDDFSMSEHLIPANDERTIYYVGGLRVRQIIKTGTDGPPVVRTFAYGANGEGHAPFTDRMNYFLVEQRKYYPDLAEYGTYHEVLTSRMTSVSSSPVVPLTYDNGAIVMYSSVTEYQGTEDNNIGKTVYTYNVPSYLQTTTPTYHINQHKYQDWRYGQLASKHVYGRSANAYVLKESEGYSYTPTGTVGRAVVSEYGLYAVCNREPSEAQTFLQTVGDLTGSFTYARHNIGISGIAARMKKHKLYDSQGRQMTDSTVISYGLAHSVLPTSQTTYINGVEPHTTYYHYPENITGQAQATAMVSANMLATVMETGSDRGDGNPVWRRTSYNTLFKPSGISTKFGNGDWSQRISNTYDSNANLVYAAKDDRENVCYVYGYNGQYVIAVLENCTYMDLCSAAGGVSVLRAIANKNCPTGSDWSLLNGLRASLPAAHVTTCKYKPLVGVTSITDPAGLEMRFVYDGLGRLSSKSIVHDGVEEEVEHYDYHYIMEDQQ